MLLLYHKLNYNLIKCIAIFNGYDFTHKDSNTNADGVGLFIKDFIRYSVLLDINITLILLKICRLKLKLLLGL